MLSFLHAEEYLDIGHWSDHWEGDFIKSIFGPERTVDNVGPPKIWSNGRALISVEKEWGGKLCVEKGVEMEKLFKQLQ